eukprot:9869408-Karenia_brevis.AAC.1
MMRWTMGFVKRRRRRRRGKGRRSSGIRKSKGEGFKSKRIGRSIFLTDVVDEDRPLNINIIE